MRIEIPGLFVVTDCLKCEKRHAPVRDCVRFIPSEEQLLHWIYDGIEGCECSICYNMRELSDQDI